MNLLQFFKGDKIHAIAFAACVACLSDAGIGAVDMVLILSRFYGMSEEATVQGIIFSLDEIEQSEAQNA